MMMTESSSANQPPLISPSPRTRAEMEQQRTFYPNNYGGIKIRIIKGEGFVHPRSLHSVREPVVKVHMGTFSHPSAVGRVNPEAKLGWVFNTAMDLPFQGFLRIRFLVYDTYKKANEEIGFHDMNLTTMNFDQPQYGIINLAGRKGFAGKLEICVEPVEEVIAQPIYRSIGDNEVYGSPMSARAETMASTPFSTTPASADRRASDFSDASSVLEELADSRRFGSTNALRCIVTDGAFEIGRMSPINGSVGGKMPFEDYFIKAMYSKHTLRSDTCVKGGMRPVFHEEFVFPFDGHQSIAFAVYLNRKMKTDVKVGTGSCSISGTLAMQDAFYPYRVEIRDKQGGVMGYLNVKCSANKMPQQLKKAEVRDLNANNVNSSRSGMMSSRGRSDSLSSVLSDLSSEIGTTIKTSTANEAVRMLGARSLRLTLLKGEELRNPYAIAAQKSTKKSTKPVIMNPYVVSKMGEETLRCRSAYKGHVSPTFVDSFYFPYEGQRFVSMEVFNDKEFSKDKRLGKTVIDLNNHAVRGPQAVTLPLIFRDRKHGVAAQSAGRVIAILEFCDAIEPMPRVIRSAPTESVLVTPNGKGFDDSARLAELKRQQELADMEERNRQAELLRLEEEKRRQEESLRLSREKMGKEEAERMERERLERERLERERLERERLEGERLEGERLERERLERERLERERLEGERSESERLERERLEREERERLERERLERERLENERLERERLERERAMAVGTESVSSLKIDHKSSGTSLSSIASPPVALMETKDMADARSLSSSDVVKAEVVAPVVLEQKISGAQVLSQSPVQTKMYAGDLIKEREAAAKLEGYRYIQGPPKSIRIRLIRAENLRPKKAERAVECDPYVVAKLGHDKRQSDQDHNTINPVFRQTMIWEFEHRHQEIEFKFKDERNRAKDETLAEGKLILTPFIEKGCNREYECVVPLTSKKGPAGQLFLSFEPSMTPFDKHNKIMLSTAVPRSIGVSEAQNTQAEVNAVRKMNSASSSISSDHIELERARDCHTIRIKLVSAEGIVPCKKPTKERGLYAEAKLGHDKRRSHEVIHTASPVFTSTFQWKYKQERNCRIRLYDNLDNKRDTKLGEGLVKIGPSIMKPGMAIEQIVPLFDDCDDKERKPRGTLRVCVEALHTEFDGKEVVDHTIL